MNLRPRIDAFVTSVSSVRTHVSPALTALNAQMITSQVLAAQNVKLVLQVRIVTSALTLVLLVGIVTNVQTEIWLSLTARMSIVATE